MKLSLLLNIKLGWRNIWRNKKRTWITVSSIAFAVFFACVMQSMQRGMYDNMIQNAVRFHTGHIGIHQIDYWDDKILDNSFPDALEIFELLDDKRIDVATQRLSSFALASAGSKTKGVAVTGIHLDNENQLTSLESKLVEGIYSDKGIMVAEGLAKYLKIGIGDTLVLIGAGYHGVNAAGKFHVSGILKFPMFELNQSTVYLDLEKAQYLYGAEGQVTSISVLLSDADDSEQVLSDLKSTISNPDLSVMQWKEMMPELLETIELDYVGGLIMIYILYAVIGFGIFGTFLMMTHERIHEFGVLLSIGMKKAKIQIMVAFEIVILSFLGVILGALASLPIVVYFFLNPILVSGDMAAAYEKFGIEPILPFALDISVFIHQAIAVLIIALVLGIYPMVTIGKLNITKSLYK